MPTYEAHYQLNQISCLPYYLYNLVFDSLFLHCFNKNTVSFRLTNLLWKWHCGIHQQYFSVQNNGNKIAYESHIVACLRGNVVSHVSMTTLDYTDWLDHPYISWNLIRWKLSTTNLLVSQWTKREEMVCIIYFTKIFCFCFVC